MKEEISDEVSKGEISKKVLSKTKYVRRNIKDETPKTKKDEISDEVSETQYLRPKICKAKYLRRFYLRRNM